MYICMQACMHACMYVYVFYFHEFPTATVRFLSLQLLGFFYTDKSHKIKPYENGS